MKFLFQSKIQNLRNNKICPKHIFLYIVDHFEPQVGKPTKHISQERVVDWVNRYPSIAQKHVDSEGMHPKHSFFYPWDEYDEWEFQRICELCKSGYGEIEIHLHHSNDTEKGLRDKLHEAKRVFKNHGALSQWDNGKTAFGFIHGNWALDNGRYTETPNHCGVNNEITILKEEGCYADFTFPAWRCIAQPRMINSIFYALDDPEKPKSYDNGRRCDTSTHQPFNSDRDNGLLIIQGILSPCIEKQNDKLHFAMDNSELASYWTYNPRRLDRWVNAGIHVKGKPSYVFIKLHCHGASDECRNTLLGQDLDYLFTDAEMRYNDGVNYILHYVTAREMFNIIKSVEANSKKDFIQRRDFLVRKC